MSPKTLSLLISAACTLAGLWSGVAPARAEAAMVAGLGIPRTAPLSAPRNEPVCAAAARPADQRQRAQH